MNKTILYGLAVLLTAPALQAQDEESAVRKEIEKTRQVIAKYVDTRQEIARVKNEWKSYQQLSERRINLYEREIKNLRETISAAEADTTQAEKEIARIQEEIQVLRDANNLVAKALPDMEQTMRELYQYFPKPLKSKVERLVKQLGKGNQASNRMAVLIGILNEVDKFNSEFNFDTDERRVGGETKLVDVIYLGLAVAYYADKDATIGGVGVPAEGGWEWTERNDLAQAIHNSVLYYNGDIKPALMVGLPVDLKEITFGTSN